MIKAIFWDNDGVLVETEHLYFEATKQILYSVGINLTKDLYIELFLKQSKGAWHLASEKGITEEKITLLKKQRNELYGNLLSTQSNVIDGVKETLETLYGKYKMGIVTSSKRNHFDIIHKQTGLLPYFNFIIANEDYVNSKPDPEPYLLAVEGSGCNKEECVAIEDSERGLRSAKDAGISCYVIPNGLTQTSDFNRADKILKNVREVLEILK